MLETIQIFDETALLWIQETVRQAWLDPLVEFYTTLGNGGLLWIVLSLALLCWRPTRKVGAAALLALLLGALCTNVAVKPLIQRPRPIKQQQTESAISGRSMKRSLQEILCRSIRCRTHWFYSG